MSEEAAMAFLIAPPESACMVKRIASYVEAAREGRASERARQAVYRCVHDLLGAAAAGLQAAGVVAVRAAARAAMGSGGVPIWFTGRSGSFIGAAWANSAAASALDLDDGHRLARGHPGAVVIPTALAVAHEIGAGHEELVNAVVIGYEVGVAIGGARTVYGNTGTWAAYAAVATAAALRRSSGRVLAHALAIAGESAPNQLFSSAAAQVPPPEGSDVKEGIPWSVVTGLIALELAEAGHTGPRNILDSTVHYRFEGELALGSALHVCNTYFKLYACCRHIHAPLDALLALIDQHGLDPREIDEIEVRTYGGALRISNKSDPDNLVDIQYSIPYCLALVAMAGPQALLPLTSEALGRAEVVALAKKVKLTLDPELDGQFPEKTLARVSVTCANRRLVSEITAPRGEAANPLTKAELDAKFRAATRRIATGNQQNQIFDAVDAFRAGRLDSLSRCLANLVLVNV